MINFFNHNHIPTKEGYRVRGSKYREHREEIPRKIWLFMISIDSMTRYKGGRKMRMVGISLEVGLLRSEDSQVEVGSSSKDGVGTLIFDPQVVIILIVNFPEHQQRNANL